MCQWCSSQFLWSISYSSCRPLSGSGWLNYFTFSTLSHLSTWNTFCYLVGFHCGYNRLRHCICVDNTTTSRLWVPCHIQVHLSSFWNHCYCATCLNNYSSPLAIHCKFMVNPDRRGSEFVQTNLSTSLLHSYFSIQTQYLACLERFVN